MAHTYKDPADGNGGATWGCSGKNEPPLNSETKRPRQGQTWKKSAIETLLIFRNKYPQCFARLDLPRRQPLKIKIHEDIIAALPELPVADVRRAIKFYVGDIKYLSACVEGRIRIDLSGLPAGTVTAEEAAHCRASLDGLLAKWGKIKKPITPAPTPPPTKKLSLSDLKAAALKRAAATGA